MPVPMTNDTHFCLDDSPWFQMIELDSVTSTNDFLRNYHPQSPKRITMVTAEYQTAGRGSGDNHWESQRGKNLVFSLLVHPSHIPASQMFVLSEVIALAVRQALSDFLPGFTIKWPNDIYHGDSKVCGMLIENELQGKLVRDCILGVGVNVNQTQFDSDAPNPASLASLLGHDIERRFVLEKIVEYFTRYYGWTEQHRADELHQCYTSQLYRKGEQHVFCDAEGDFQGTICDVEPTGHLIIVDEMGRNRRYAFKEVSYKL